jgi:hypothetical protein
LGLLLYVYATGVFSSRKIERTAYEAVPFRFIAGNLHPDHDTLATFRRTFLPGLKDLFVQVLLLVQEAGVLTLARSAWMGTKIHADVSRHNAVSYKRLLELEAQLRAEEVRVSNVSSLELWEERQPRHFSCGLKLLQCFPNIINNFWRKRILCTSNVSYLPYRIPLRFGTSISSDVLSRILP